MSKAHTKLPFILLLAAVAVSVPLVLGFLGSVHPAFDAFSHFRAHLAVLMAVLALPLVFTQMRREAAMVILLAVLAFGSTTAIAHRFLGSTDEETPAHTAGPRYSLIQINLRYDNSEPKRVLQMIAREKPDVITYQEAGPDWTMWIDILKSTYPYHVECRIDGPDFGTGILSRRPISESDAQACSAGGRLASAAIDFGGTFVTVAAYHSALPWPYGQNDSIGEMVPGLQKLDGLKIIAGDFNAVPWSYAVKRIAKASGTEAVPDIGGTWLPHGLPTSLTAWIGLPIDQLLVSPEVEMPVAASRPYVGSDHLPVRLDFSVPAPVRPDHEEPETQSVML
ncbi:endonuclease/exonuclease/phosphatase family protein [Brucella sp. BE17]|uniref:endonuclease/exonuclease/phosphatase family protein n=1 Tax=Brucella sp. BE17 TaxID=3142977 RepID=UPI0031BB1464